MSEKDGFDITRVHDISELPDLRKLKTERCGLPKNWSFCMGGEHLDRDQWAVKLLNEDYSEDLYPLPLWITTLIRWERSLERESMQRDLCRLLGIERLPEEVSHDQ